MRIKTMVPCIIPGQPGMGCREATPDELGCCKVPTIKGGPNQPDMVVWEEPKKQEKKMYNTYDLEINNSRDSELSKRNYLANRLYQETSEKVQDLRQDFGLVDDAAPDTAEDFLKRIKDGKFILREASIWNTTFEGRVRWRDPDLKEDNEGFDEATAKLGEARQAAEDVITIMPPEKGLEAFNTFAEMKFN